MLGIENRLFLAALLALEQRNLKAGFLLEQGEQWCGVGFHVANGRCRRGRISVAQPPIPVTSRIKPGMSLNPSGVFENVGSCLTLPRSLRKHFRLTMAIEVLVG